MKIKNKVSVFREKRKYFLKEDQLNHLVFVLIFVRKYFFYIKIIFSKLFS
jgi:hypothetical protein